MNNGSEEKLTEADQTWLTIEEIELLITDIKPFTMVSNQRAFGLVRSVEKVIKNDVPGDFVECGVWAGGLCMLMANTLKALSSVNRKVWLFDTFTGMTEPDDRDKSIEYGHKASERWEAEKQDGYNAWCYASEDDVRQNLKATEHPTDLLQFVKGDVLETIPGNCPSDIAVLRLDTDWYASTLWELQHLYPKLSSRGVLIIDDYSDWSGSKQAVEEYFGPSFFGLEKTTVDGCLIIVKP